MDRRLIGLSLVLLGVVPRPAHAQTHVLPPGLEGWLGEALRGDARCVLEGAAIDSTHVVARYRGSKAPPDAPVHEVVLRHPSAKGAHRALSRHFALHAAEETEAGCPGLVEALAQQLREREPDASPWRAVDTRPVDAPEPKVVQPQAGDEAAFRARLQSLLDGLPGKPSTLEELAALSTSEPLAHAALGLLLALEPDADQRTLLPVALGVAADELSRDPFALAVVARSHPDKELARQLADRALELGPGIPLVELAWAELHVYSDFSDVSERLETWPATQHPSERRQLKAQASAAGWAWLGRALLIILLLMLAFRRGILGYSRLREEGPGWLVEMLLVGGLVALAAWRSYAIFDWTDWGADGLRDLRASLSLSDHGGVLPHGPGVMPLGFHLGPHYYELLALGFDLWRSPHVLVVMGVSCFGLTGALAYDWVRRFADRRVALIGILLMVSSDAVVGHLIQITHGTWTPLLALLVLRNLWEWHRSPQARPLSFVAAFLWLGIATNFHYTAAGLGLAAVLTGAFGQRRASPLVITAAVAALLVSFLPGLAAPRLTPLFAEGADLSLLFRLTSGLPLVVLGAALAGDPRLVRTRRGLLVLGGLCLVAVAAPLVLQSADTTANLLHLGVPTTIPEGALSPVAADPLALVFADWLPLFHPPGEPLPGGVLILLGVVALALALKRAERRAASILVTTTFATGIAITLVVAYAAEPAERYLALSLAPLPIVAAFGADLVGERLHALAHLPYALTCGLAAALVASGHVVVAAIGAIWLGRALGEQWPRLQLAPAALLLVVAATISPPASDPAPRLNAEFGRGLGDVVDTLEGLTALGLDEEGIQTRVHGMVGRHFAVTDHGDSTAPVVLDMLSDIARADPRGDDDGFTHYLVLRDLPEPPEGAIEIALRRGYRLSVWPYQAAVQGQRAAASGLLWAGAPPVPLPLPTTQELAADALPLKLRVPRDAPTDRRLDAIDVDLREATGYGRCEVRLSAAGRPLDHLAGTGRSGTVRFRAPPGPAELELTIRGCTLTYLDVHDSVSELVPAWW